MTKGAIRLEAVEKWFGDVQVIKGIDLEISPGEFVVFVGPSGCGKSTLLRMISGLEETSYGKIEIDGSDATTRLPSERGLSMVFQSYALYPHMSVAENIGFGLKTAGAPKAEIKAKVSEAAEVLELTDYLARRPKDLSGGQRQRVAIGRAIVRDPAAFLFDEPLSNLDAALRVQMRFEISKLHERLGASMIYVTHDQVEAMTLADKIVVLRAGEIMQVGSPRTLYERPDNLFVAQFIGSPKMNIVDCAIEAGEIRLADGTRIQCDQPLPSSASKLGVRPEHVSVLEDGAGAVNGVIEFVEYLGADTYYYVTINGEDRILVRDTSDRTLESGAAISLGFEPAKLHLFSDQGERVGPTD